MKNNLHDNADSSGHLHRQELSSQAYSLMKTGDFKKAKENFKKLINDYPSLAVGYIGIARLYQNEKNWIQANEYWDEVLSKVDDKDIKFEWCALKIRALMNSKRASDAEAFYKSIIAKKGPSPILMEGFAKAYEDIGELNKAFTYWKEIQDQYPDHQTIALQFGRLYHQKREFEESEKCLITYLSKSKNYIGALEVLAKNARESRQYELAKCRWFELMSLQPQKSQYKNHYVYSLLDLLEFDAAQKFFKKHLNEDSPCSYQVLEADIYRSKFDFDSAFKVLDKLEKKFPNEQVILQKKVRYLIVLTKSTGDLNYATRGLKLINQMLKTYPMVKDLCEMKVELLIILNKKNEAQSAIKKLYYKKSQKAMNFQIWSKYMDGDIDHAKELWRDLKEYYKIPSLKMPESQSLTQISSRRINIHKNSIILFTAVKNELWRLPWFLDYYRSQGVDKFFFIDNDSSDGTKEYLLEQKDVHLFWTNQVYANAYAGIQWVNTLLDKYGAGCWCMYVDVDEALIFPGIESRNIRSITRYMEDHGQEALHGFMLDMFSPGMKSILREDNYKGFFKDYSLFNSDYSWIDTAGCPFKHTTGGVRKALTIFDTQTKTPIIKGGAGINFILSSHIISPSVLSDVTCVLLHFKLSGDFHNYFNKEIEESTRGADCKRRHWSYLNAFKKFDENEDFIGENTHSYESSQQLVDLKLMRTSKEFEDRKYD